MRVSCACPVELASSTLEEKIRTLGITPIVTTQVIRAVYDGPDKSIGEAIVNMYAHEADHEINVQYTTEEQRKIDRKLARKYERAKRNAELHGHTLVDG